MPESLVQLTDFVVNRVAFVPAGDNPNAHVTIWKGARSSDPARRADLVRAQAEHPAEGHVSEKALGADQSLQDYIDAICDAWCDFYQANVAGPMQETSTWVREVYLDHVIVNVDGGDYSVPYAATDAGPAFDVASAVEVERTWTPEVSTEAAGAGDMKAGGRKEEPMTTTRKDLPDDLPEEVQKYLDAIEKERDEATAEAETLRAEKAAADPAPDPDPIEKALEGADPTVKAAIDAIRKQAEDADARAKAAGEEVEKLRVEKADAAAVAEVSDLKFLPVKAEDLGPKMRKLHDLDADLAEDITKVLTATNGIAAEAFKEIGRRGATSGSGDAMAELNQKAEQIRTAEPTLTKEQAFTKAMDTPEGKALYRKYEEEVNA